MLPVIPRYSEAPYAAIVGGDDPARIGMIFDDRYFAVTNELNLLNSLLIAEAEEIKVVVIEKTPGRRIRLT